MVALAGNTMADQVQGRVEPRKSVVVVKARRAWASWYRKLAKHSRMPGPVLVEIALKEWAERNSFRDPPPER